MGFLWPATYQELFFRVIWAVIPFRDKLRTDAIAVENGVTKLDDLLSRREVPLPVGAENMVSKDLGNGMATLDLGLPGINGHLSVT